MSALLALVPVMFSYSGWNAAVYVAEEVRDPARNVPLALALGTVTVVILYVALNALYVFALPLGELAALPGGRLMDTVAERLFGFAAGNLIALFTIVSIAASISAMVLAGPRVYFAMARDGMFVRAAGRVHPAVPHAGGGDRRAERVELRAGAVGHAGAARDLHRLRGGALFRGRGQRAVRAPPPRCRRAAAILRAGLSVGAGDLRAWRARRSVRANGSLPGPDDGARPASIVIARRRAHRRLGSRSLWAYLT